MKLRNKVTIANMIIISIVLAVSSLAILNVTDNANLHTVYQYLLRQSNFSQQYLSEYLKAKTNPSDVFEYNRLSLEKLLKEQAGCEVVVTSHSDQSFTPLQRSA